MGKYKALRDELATRLPTSEICERDAESGVMLDDSELKLVLAALGEAEKAQEKQALSDEQRGRDLVELGNMKARIAELEAALANPHCDDIAHTHLMGIIYFIPLTAPRELTTMISIKENSHD